MLDTCNQELRCGTAAELAFKKLSVKIFQLKNARWLPTKVVIMKPETSSSLYRSWCRWQSNFLGVPAAILWVALAAVPLSGCNVSDVKEALDVADGVPRKTIDANILGTNAFVNDGRFGSMESQFREVKNVLRLSHVRVLFAWNDAVQPSAAAAPNFGFYDDIMASLPAGVDALVVLTGLPSWASRGGDPRDAFVDRWVAPVAERYGSHPKVVGFQIWNEPNTSLFPENEVMNFRSAPGRYVEMLARAHQVIKARSGKLVVNAATTSINQGYPESLDYNRAMRDAGARQFVDVWAVHYYGKLFENVVRSGGVADFLNGLGKDIWITESGAQGVNAQLAYGETAWPFLTEKIPGIRRIYQYQFTEATPQDVSYGMRTLDPAAPISDLYVYLRDR